MNQYAMDLGVKSRQQHLQAEARMARLEREARDVPRTPDVREARVFGHRLATAAAGLLVAVALLAGTAIAQSTSPTMEAAAVPEAGAGHDQEETEPRQSRGVFIR